MHAWSTTRRSAPPPMTLIAAEACGAATITTIATPAIASRCKSPDIARRYAATAHGVKCRAKATADKKPRYRGALEAEGEGFERSVRLPATVFEFPRAAAARSRSAPARR